VDHSRLNWAQYCGVGLAEWPAVQDYVSRMEARPSVARAFSEEMALYKEEQARRSAA
jgi:glutathione S-transferase